VNVQVASLTKIQNLALFHQKALPFLVENEAEYSLILGIVENALRMETVGDFFHFWIAESPKVVADSPGVAADSQGVSGVCIATDKNIVVSRFPHNLLHKLAVELVNTVSSSLGVVGCEIEATELASKIANERNETVKLAMSQTIYQLKEVVEPQSPGGEFIIP
jgi:hypothetical protein